MNDQAVALRMTALMGPELGHLKNNLAVTGTVGLVDCDLVLQGNARHMGGDEDAVLDLNLASGMMTAGIQSGAKAKIFIAPGASGSKSRL